MEFGIDIHTQPNGEIIVEDYSKEYGQYIDENLEVITSYDSYKYSECVTLNTITKIETCNITLIDVLLNEHSEELDSCTFKVKKDGYYVVDHFVLPNMKWLENATESNKEYYETIYVTDGQKLYKLINNELEECTIKEIMERNIEGTTIKKCKVDIFFTGHLQQCYINQCKELFDIMLNSCAGTVDTFSRDFIWMTLNVIDYLIGFKQYMEAQRIVEVFKSCGSFCNQKKPYVPKVTHCGCS